MIRTTIMILALLSAGGPALAQMQTGKILSKLGLDKKQNSDDGTVASGLKEALKIGTGNTVDLTGQLDGYLKNEAIKILMPDSLRQVEKGLRMVGFGEKIDEFVVSMNRAAETAAPWARDIFWDAIKEMSIEDAQGILTGGETAATDYFRTQTGDSLSQTFRPIVEKSMEESGVTRQYDELMNRFNSIPFSSKASFDIDDYVVEKALDGLFHVLAEEERKIRTNPAARVTDLLKKVFG